MDTGIPGLGALVGDDPTHCPLCNEPVTGNDGLQLHYLTSCASYDRLSNEQPRSKPRKAPASEPSTQQRNTFGPLTSVSSDVGGAKRDVASGGASSIQFMWQPLTEITYPEIMLLASFEPGSVPLKLDSDGGHYASAKVSIPNGTYDGQLVIGDSFIYPVKKFTVSKPDDIIVLQFDLEQGKHLSGENTLTVPATSQYGTGNMQQNPSFSGYGGSDYMYPQTSGYGGSDYYPPTSGYSGSSSFQQPSDYGQSGGYSQSGGQSGISSNLTDRSSGFNYYSQMYGSTTQSTIQPRVTRHTPSETTLPSNENVPVPKTTRATTATTATSNMGHTTKTNVRATTAHTAQDSTNTTTARASTHINTVSTVQQPVVKPPAEVPPSSSGQSPSAFNVGVLQQEELEESSDIRQLREQLKAVKKERDELKQNQHRVNARWDGRVKRLEAELETTRASGQPPTQGDSHTEALREAQGVITRLEREVATLQREKESVVSNAQDSSELERQLQEMKDRNTALEHQLLEYAGTITDQSKYIQSSVARDKAQTAGSIASQQDLIHLTAFAKKQQLENAEALADLKKKISTNESGVHGSQEVQLTNVRLAAEIEDYRDQTKRLLHDISQKDEEIGRLRESLTHQGSQSSDQLELATLREKVIAYQDEFDKRMNEVDQLRERAAQQDSEIRRLTSDNEDLTSQLQAVIDNAENKDPEITRKANEYDTLMERFHELQQTRINLEGEIQHLRQNWSTVLQENALLREGSEPQKYAKLKQEHDVLISQYQNLQNTVAEQNEILASQEGTNREMQTKLDQATNPEMLHGIRTRMDRYKEERDNARRRGDELEKHVVVLQAEKHQALEKLQEATDQSERVINEFQTKVAAQDVDINRIHHVEANMVRYREERNTARKRCKDLEKQVALWRELVLKSQPGEIDPSAEYDLSLGSPYPSGELPASPSSDYHPQAYTENTLQHLQRESVASPLADIESGMSSLTLEPSKAQRKRTTSGTRPKQISESSSFEMVDVKTKDGVKVVNIGRLRGGLSAKHKPKVIVKRGEEYEQGTLAFVGDINGKEVAGVQLDCRITRSSGSSNYYDGSHPKDGKYYFRCPPGFGVYVSPSKLFVEMESAYV